MTSSPVPIRVLIVDDHEIVREGLTALLSEEPDIVVAGQAAGGREALAIAPAARPHVILMDLMMPEMGGIEAIRELARVDPAARVLVLTSFMGDRHVQEALQAGAIGYVMKDVLKADLLRAIRQAAAGRPTLDPEAQHALIRRATRSEPPPHTRLTERERDVLALIAQGKSNKEIAAGLHLSEGTVKGYVSAILAKLELADRTQAALYAVKHGLG